MEISFIVPLFNHLEHTRAMLSSLLASLPPGLDYEIILVDDFSTDGTRAWLATLSHPRIKVVLNPKNLAYAASNNAGARMASGELLALLNNDLLLAPGWLEPMIRVLRHPGLNAGIVGNVQYQVDDGRLDHAGVRLNHRGQFEHVQSLPVHGLGYQKSLALTGACLLIRRVDFNSAGGFDESFINGCEDLDLCFKIRTTSKQLFVALNSHIRHHVSLSRDRHTLQDSRNSQRLYAKWRTSIKSNLANELASSMNDGTWIGASQHTHPAAIPSPDRPYAAALILSETMLQREESYWAKLLAGPPVVWPTPSPTSLNGGQYRYENGPLRVRKQFSRDLAEQRVLFRQPLRKSIKLKLRPQHEIDIDPIHPERWISYGKDPYFIVDTLNRDYLKAGWYQINFTIESTHKKNCAKIYYDYGPGFSEFTATTIKYNDSLPTKHIIKIGQHLKTLRFDPMDKLGGFSIASFALQPLCESQALAEMLSTINDENKSALNFLNDEPILRNTTDVSSDLNIERVFKAYQEKHYSATGSISYQQWIKDVEIPSLPDETLLNQTLAEMQVKPLISIVMPTFNTAERHLCACIESVIDQSYPNWELCIADDASTMPHVRQVLAEYGILDARIKLVYRPQNGHISRASNSALEIAKGDYVALLDHDDELPRDALYFVVLTIDKNSDLQIIYSDEDKIDKYGKRTSPHFKSDWNPDLFYSQNYVCHLGVYKRDLLNRIGGFRVGVEGSQDQDLLLRCLPHVRTTQIAHIPRVLYHWRAEEGSTALASVEKPYTSEAGIKALRDHFSTLNSLVRIEAGSSPNTYRVRWPIPEPAPLVSLLIPTRDRRELTETCVRSILDKSTYTHYEVLVLDNGSVEPVTLTFFDQIQREDGRVRVLRYDHPFNFSAINNFGVQHSRGEIIGMINNDIEVINPEWLTELVSHAVRPDIGCVGAKLYYDNKTIQHAGVILGLSGVAGHSHKHFDMSDAGYFNRLKNTQNLSAVTGACLIVRRSIYDAVSGLDDENLKIAFNDVDFCLKVRDAGYRNLWTPHAELYHHESISRGHEDTPEKKERFQREVDFMKLKWGDSLMTDPYYNPNLTTDREDFTF